MNENQPSRTTLYQLAALGGTGRAELIRSAICEEALLDDEWREMYDERLARHGDDPENSVLPSSAAHLPPASDPKAEQAAARTFEMLRKMRASEAPAGIGGTQKHPRGRRFRLSNIERAHYALQAAGVGVLAGASWVLLPGGRDGSLGLALGGFMTATPLETVFRGALLGTALFSLPLAVVRDLPKPARRLTLGALGGLALTIGYSPAVAATFAVLGAIVGVLSLLGASDARTARSAHRRRTRSTRPATAAVTVPTQTLYGTSMSSAQAVTVLRAHASRLGAPVGPIDSTDAAAAMIGADVWMFALGARWFDQAASFGPVSVGSLAAVLARAAGESVSALPDLGGETANESMFPGLGVFLASWTNAADANGNSRDILRRAADDLMWGGGGDDRLSRLGRSLRQHADRI